MASPTFQELEGADGLLDGRYRLIELVGEGGYARVYRAYDEVLGREVAVKLFTVETPDARDAQRMASETRLLATLNHPSLVTLFDARLDAAPGYLVMEFVTGPTLREAIAAGALDESLVASLAVDLAEALQVIHTAGVVHRDIKPSNVLLRTSPLPGGAARATLADFGIASLVDTTRVTATGTLVGTAAYLSPEQARGEKPAPATDIYSLGLVLLEALTGERAFPQGTPHEALAARLVHPPRLPAHLSPEWRGLLSAMTALDPARRPDAATVARAAEGMRERGTHAAPVAAGATETVSLSGTDEPRGLTAPTLVAPAPPPPPLPERPPTSAAAAAEPRRRPLRRAWWLAGAAAAVAVIAATIMAGSGTFAPGPALPPVPEQLRAPFDELWRQVQ